MGSKTTKNGKFLVILKCKCSEQTFASDQILDDEVVEEKLSDDTN